MGFELQDANPSTDFPAIARCFFDSFENPPQPLAYAWFPIHGNTHDAREEAIAECATRLQSWDEADPTSYWQKVVDTDTGRIAGAALWNINKENPFAHTHQTEVAWFPDNGSRRFAEQFLKSHAAPRARIGPRPQVCK